MDEKTIRKHVATIVETIQIMDDDKAHGSKVEQLKKDSVVAASELAAEVVISLVRIANGLSVAQGSPLIERPAGKPGKG
jgi:hypothetical protein